MADPTVTVRGRGLASATPDGARIRVGVRARSPSAADAHDEASTRLASVEALLVELGVARDVVDHLAGVGAWARAVGRGGAGRARHGLPATAEIDVVLEDPGTAGRLVASSVVRADAHVEGPWWRVLPSNPAWEAATEGAVRDGAARAAAVARALGMELGPVVEVIEGGGERSLPGGFPCTWPGPRRADPRSRCTPGTWRSRRPWTSPTRSCRRAETSREPAIPASVHLTPAADAGAARRPPGAWRPPSARRGAG